MKLDLNYLLELSIKAVCEASEEILKIYNNANFDVEKKTRWDSNYFGR